MNTLAAVSSGWFPNPSLEEMYYGGREFLIVTAAVSPVLRIQPVMGLVHSKYLSNDSSPQIGVLFWAEYLCPSQIHMSKPSVPM